MNERPSKYDLPYTKFQKMVRAYRRGFPVRFQGRWGCYRGSNWALGGGGGQASAEGEGETEGTHEQSESRFSTLEIPVFSRLLSAISPLRDDEMCGSAVFWTQVRGVAGLPRGSRQCPPTWGFPFDFKKMTFILLHIRRQVAPSRCTSSLRENLGLPFKSGGASPPGIGQGPLADQFPRRKSQVRISSARRQISRP
jgi:hypothetical protein